MGVEEVLLVRILATGLGDDEVELEWFLLIVNGMLDKL